MQSKSLYSKYVIFLGLFAIFFYSAFGIFIGPNKAIAQTDRATMIQAVATGYLAPIRVITQYTQPVAINVPSLDLQIPIEVGSYDYQKHEWSINDNSAFYADITSKLNTTSGQTVIYAHNKNSLFGKLKSLNSNDLVILTDESAQDYTFALTNTRLVKPTDTSVFYEKPDKPILVLITCDGLFDENRKLLYFSLVGVN